MKDKILIWFWILFPLISFSQGENDNWYFGYKAAVNFSAVAPVALTNSAMSALEACGSVSDAKGNLLFYTDGITIWDRDHNIMPNGTGLTGTVNSAQTLIIGEIGNKDRYYVFTTADSYNNQSYTAYSVVDMTLGSLGSTGQPLGDVDPAVKNVPVLDNNGNLITTGAVTAVPHANGTDFWILIPTHDDLLAFQLSASGLNTVPVVNYFGFTSYPYRSFSIKASPKLSYSIGFDYILALGRGHTLESDQCDLLTFDSNTGLLVGGITSIVNAQNYRWNGEFNDDGTIMYLATSEFGNCHMYKYDIINNNFQPLSVLSGLTPGQIQRNSKGEIYFALAGTGDLGQILNPNSFISCFADPTNLFLNGQNAYMGLPQLLVENTGATCINDIFLTVPETNNNYTYRANNSITTQTNYSINTMNIDMKAGANILLLPDTEIGFGSNYTAVIEDCPFSKPSKRYWMPPIEKQIYTVGTKNNITSGFNDMKVFPNPTTNSFTIETNNNEIQKWELFDLSGKQVLEGKESFGSVESLAKATYILKVSLKNNEVNTHKLIVK